MSDSKRLIRGPKIYPVKITVRSSPPDPDSQSVGEDYSYTSKPTPPHEVLSSSDFVEVGVTGPETISVDLVMDSGSSYNVVFVGYSGVGKTALISRIADLNPSLDRHFSTSGVEIKIHTVEKDHKTTKLCIRETACFGTSNSSCFRDADGFVVVYDATNQHSFNYVKEVLEQIGCHGSGNVKKVLVGNKSDLDEGKVVSFETAKAFADELGIPFMETSAKNSINVELCIMTMFSEMTYRDWANLPIDLLIKIFTASPLLPPDTRSSMVTVCSNWCKAIFSSPPWPELLFPLVYLGERFHYLIYDEQCDRFFEVVDPIRNLGPVKLSMRLIGGNGRKFLFVDSMRRCLVVWNLVSEPGMPYLYPQEVFLDLPSDSLSLENINLGSIVIVEESTLRVVLVSGNLLLASSFDKSGHQLVQWTEVADFSGSSSRRFELIVFCNGTAFLLDELARLCSVSWEGSGVVLREMPFVSSLHNPFMPELDRKISNFRTFILSLPATELNSPEKLVCLSYQIDISSIFYGYFLASEILEDAETGLMDFSELTDLGGCSILLSKSRAAPCVLQSPEVFGYKRNSVYHLSAEVDQVDDDKLVLKMRSFCLKEPFYKDVVIPFGAKWPYQFVVLPDPSQLPKSETNERGLHKAP